MGVLEPVPYIGVWEPYIGVRPCADVIPLCLLAPLERQRGKKAELILRSEQRHIRKWTDQVLRFTAVCSQDYEKTTEQISSKRSGGMEHGPVHVDVDLEMFHLFLNIMIFSFCTNTHVKHVCTYMVVKRCRSTEMVWQVEWSSTRAVDSVASFTTPMYPGKRTRREKASASSLWKTRSRPGGDDSTDQTSVTWSFCRLTFVRSLRNTNRLTNQLIVSPTSAPSHSSSSSTSSTTTSSSSSCSSSGSSCSSSSLLSTWTTTATQHQALSKFLVRSLNYKVTKTNPIKQERRHEARFRLQTEQEKWLLTSTCPITYLPPRGAWGCWCEGSWERILPPWSSSRLWAERINTPQTQHAMWPFVSESGSINTDGVKYAASEHPQKVTTFITRRQRHE